MPQDGSNNYQYPPGTPGIPDQTIQSESYNTFLDDLVNNDLNIPRPITRGGTGANNANNALVNLTGEKATQLVTDYSSQVWLPGSFYSASSATAAPVAGHAFAGIVTINEPLVFPPTNANVTVEARDQSDTTVPGRVYVRQKKAGVWDASWSVQAGSIADMDAAYVNTAGDTMTGLLTASGNPTADFHVATKQYVDGGVAGIPGKVSKAGDVMTGFLTLSGDPVDPLHAATKQSVVAKAGDTMTGLLTLSGNPTAALHAATKQYVDARPAANLLVNGGFQVNQIGHVSNGVLSAGTYGHDQWKAGASGGDYSFTQLKSSTQITIASGKTLIQPIEDANVVGGSYVLSWTGTAQARAGVNTLTPSGAYAGSPLLITGQTAGTAMSVEFNAGTLGTVKLESGAIVTPFLVRPYDQELSACQRYYCHNYPLGSYPLQQFPTMIGVATCFSANSLMTQTFSLPTSMRANPTLQLYPPAFVNGDASTPGNWQLFLASAGTYYNCFIVTVFWSNHGFSLQMSANGVSGANANQAFFVKGGWSADARL